MSLELEEAEYKVGDRIAWYDDPRYVLFNEEADSFQILNGYFTGTLKFIDYKHEGYSILVDKGITVTTQGYGYDEDDFENINYAFVRVGEIIVDLTNKI